MVKPPNRARIVMLSYTDDDMLGYPKLRPSTPHSHSIVFFVVTI